MCGQPTAYNTYATLPYTNPLFMGFSRSQNVNKEIIIYHFRYIKNPQKSNAFVGSFFSELLRFRLGGTKDMVTLLSKLWIKSDNYKDSKVREKYGVLCGAVGIFLNVLLFLGKFLAGLLSGAISITADAFNNLSDAGSSFISMIGFKLSGRNRTRIIRLDMEE